VNQFSFFRSYYEATSMLDDADRLAFYDAILEYIFCDKSPGFTGVKGMAWILIEPNLSTSKKRSHAGKTESKEIKQDQTESKEIKQDESPPRSRSRKGVGKKTTKAVRPDNFLLEDWENLLAHRQAMKAPLTPLALSGLVKQFEQSEFSTADCIQEMANRGWKGFKALWLVDKGKRKNGGAEIGASGFQITTQKLDPAKYDEHGFQRT